MNTLTPGLTGQCSETVLYTNTALSLGSGLLNVYATPAMVALMEKAAVLTISPYLVEGEGSVGIKLEITHDRATLPGHIITATAELLEIEGRKLTFKVSAADEQGIIGQGLHQRFVIDNEKFLAKLK